MGERPAGSPAGSAGEQLIHGVDNHRASDVSAGIEHELLERLAIFAGLDRVDLCADQLDVVLLENAQLVQAHGRVQSGLAAQGRQNRVWLLFGDDRLDNLWGNRFDVGSVGEVGVGHDGGWVRVDQNHSDAFGAQNAAGLGARVVKLAGLADNDRA